ncbi:hypothetical protein RF55_9459 [Lasius niger]|uniref:Double jelly roll-like domain-containing protein n=1 Tax=Lasius niger TaxID=67767 RepID=A0A0J7KKD0_LASNI|nr:hypothetical protein RF55_9459 [Lasius niger]
MTDMLNIGDEPIFDDRIVKIETHTYNPFANTTLGHTKRDYEEHGWDTQTNANRYLNFCVPLYMLLGFCEDYRRVVINDCHELILIRSRNDNNCLFGDLTLEPVINIFKVQWRMPHVLLSEINKLSMLRALESGRYLVTGPMV